MQGTTNTRRRAFTRNGVVAGSVWETRIKMDEVKGGIKVFNGSESQDDDSNADEEGMRVYQKLRRRQSDSVTEGRRKRRNWTPPKAAENVLIEKRQIQLRKAIPEVPNLPRFRLANAKEIKVVKPVLLIGDGTEGGDEDEKVEEVEIEIEVENKSFDDKEIDQPEEKPKNMEEDKRINQINEIPELLLIVKNEQTPVILSSPVGEKKLIPVSFSSPNVENEQNSVSFSSPQVEKKKNPVSFSSPQLEKKQSPVSFSSPQLEKKQSPMILPSGNLEKKQSPPVIELKKVDPDQLQSTPSEIPENVFHCTFDVHNRMLSIVDLIMWRDASKSAFVFGFGTFLLISSSYSKDLNFSLISAASYLGLIYLASIFIYKSILNRGEAIDYEERDERYMVGEEEAIWLLRLILPYFNELLFRFRSLFSGDPATTMKLALLLFVMARCGSSITVWTLAKLVFFGVFTIPKVCSSYSTQLAKYGRFWLQMFRDGWESCTHKKAVAAAIFTLIWNISSTVVRIWAVFMLAVAMKFYQQCLGDQDWGSGREEVEEVVGEQGKEDSKAGQSQGHGLPRRQRGGPTRSPVVAKERKIKKGL